MTKNYNNHVVVKITRKNFLSVYLSWHFLNDNYITLLMQYRFKRDNGHLKETWRENLITLQWQQVVGRQVDIAYM